MTSLYFPVDLRGRLRQRSGVNIQVPVRHFGIGKIDRSSKPRLWKNMNGTNMAEGGSIQEVVTLKNQDASLFAATDTGAPSVSKRFVRRTDAGHCTGRWNEQSL